MKILFITHRLPCPPDQGCKIRSAALLHGLTQRHDVWCAGFFDRHAERELQGEAQASMTALRQECRGFLAVPFRSGLAGYRALAGMIAGGTATESYFKARHLRTRVLAWSREIGFDAVFAFSSGIAPLALEASAPRRVLCMDDLDSRKWADLAVQARWPMKRIYGTESRRLAVRERDWMNRFDATLMVSAREADLVTDPDLRLKVHVVPPILRSLGESDSTMTPVAATGPVVGFMGVMDYEPNVDAACWLAGDIWPRVRTQCPGARLLLVGRSPNQAVRDLGRNEGISVTGTVPTIEGYLSAMRVHVAPLRVSRGVQIKVLTAMAAGRPCVVTSCVAEGLEARAGRDVLVADSSAAFAAAVVDLLENPEKAQALGRAGQQFVRRFDPDQVIRRVECLLEGSLEVTGASRSDLKTETTSVERCRPQAALALH